MNTPTQADVQEERELTRYATQEIIQQLSLAPDTSIVHNVEACMDGLRITYEHPPYDTMYLYALPWSRGWSVFTTNDPDAGAYSWRDVPAKLKSLQQPIYCERDKTGPWTVPPMFVARAINEIAAHLDTLKARRLRRQELKEKHDRIDAEYAAQLAALDRTPWPRPWPWRKRNNARPNSSV